MNYKEEHSSRLNEVEDIIKRYLPAEEGFQKTVIEAMNYSFLAGGKRLRPMLMLETYRLFGGNTEAVYPFMAAIEMIHTYSLIHDDLPAMDNDDYRRGRKTTHVVYGEAVGILAGDGLLNYAYEVMAQAFKTENADMIRIADALTYMAGKAGIYGMVGGQTVDVIAEKNNQTIDKDRLDFIFRLKTGALIEAAMVTGAILAGAAKEEIDVIEGVATRVGMAFQIQDDILDVTSSFEVLGKPIGSDEKNGKVTYVTLYGMDKAKSDVEKYSEEAIKELKALGKENEFLIKLIEKLINREK